MSRYYRSGRERLAAWTVVAGLVAVGVMAVWALILGINGAMRHQRSANCEHLAEQTGMETRYIEVSMWDFDCYVQVDGMWIPRGQVRGEVTR